MDNTAFFQSVGAVVRAPSEYPQLDVQGLMQAEPVYDFGYAGVDPSTKTVPRIEHTPAAVIKGAWDGQTNFSLFKLAEKIIGGPLPAQKQTAGTCTSRGSSLAANLLQMAMIAAGEPLEFKWVAHAPIYGGGRELGHMLGPPGQDGCVGEYVCKSMSEIGVTFLEQINDTYDSDKMACEYGYHGVPSNVKEYCRTHLVKEYLPVKTFGDAADFIVSGNPIVVCSMQGFSMQRDSDGFCRPEGQWAHCMCFGATVNVNGRKGLGCAQSWGKNTPSGPVLIGCPDHVFGVDEQTVNRMLAMHDSFALRGLSAWRRQNWPVDWDLWS